MTTAGPMTESLLVTYYATYGTWPEPARLIYGDNIPAHLVRRAAERRAEFLAKEETP